jgi:hypothetical protein
MAFDLQKAREALSNAKRALEEAEERFDNECTPDNTALLMRQIVSAERRVAEARADVTRLEFRCAG